MISNAHSYSDRIVTASESGAEWQRAMRQRSHSLLEAWNADLVVVGGIVERSGNIASMSLWFVPREGNDSLDRAYSSPYSLQDGQLGDDFFTDLIGTIAVTAVALDQCSGVLTSVGDDLESLLERTEPTVFPDRWAHLNVVYGLVQVALVRCMDDTSSRLERALIAHRNALEIYSDQGDKTKWLETQRLLVAALREGRLSYKREDDPLVWAQMRLELGTALLNLAQQEGGAVERLEEAVVVYREALQVYSRENTPSKWASIQSRLGTTLVYLAQQEGGTVERLEEAAAAYESELQVYSREDNANEWANTNANIGSVFSMLSQSEEGGAYLEKSVTAYTRALEVYSREDSPLRVAVLRTNLGIALRQQGVRDDDIALLQRAVSMFQEALEVYHGASDLLKMAVVQYNLANALMELSERDGSSRLEDAVALFDGAIAVFNRTGRSDLVELAQRDRERTIAILR